MPARSKPHRSRSVESQAGAQRAFSIALQLPEQSDHEVHASLVELTRLAATLGIEVVASITQKRDALSGSYLGEGKLREVAERLRDFGPEGSLRPLVVVDGELTPGQHRALEVALETEVLDRSGVILRIFERRAQTQRARLEVELARLTYELPRVRDDAAVRNKQGGGAGRGERGHTAVELGKQQMRDRLAKLRKELSALQDADEPRSARKHHATRAVTRVALVGYTNAGKSSLMRALTGSQVLVEDKLFATLGVTTRALAPPAQPAVVLSDTVGFIQRLPHELVASFRSTLAEARDAELLLLVVDASDPDWRAQLDVTRATLESLGVRVEQRVVLNKIDRLSVSERLALAGELPDALQLSAHAAQDVALLRAAILESADAALHEAVLKVPYAHAALTAEIRSQARVVEERFTDDGAVVRIRARPAVIERWKAAL
jgi:GTP-binding protein HflX